MADPGLAHAQYSPACSEGFKCAAWDICEYDIRAVVVDVEFNRRQTLRCYQAVSGIGLIIEGLNRRFPVTQLMGGSDLDERSRQPLHEL